MTDITSSFITLLNEKKESQVTDDTSALSTAASRWMQSLQHNLRHVSNLTIADIMIPRTDIKALNVEEDPGQLLKEMIQHGYSRYPLYQGTLDKVIGMVHIRSALAQLSHGSAFDVTAIMQSCLFVSPSMTVLDLLLEMRDKRIHMALVVDEFGGNDGLVTFEDLIEQIIGAIEDEHDDDNETMLIHESEATILTSARIKLEELEETIGSFQTDEDAREDVDTLGGLVYGMLGRIPKRGELVQHGSGLQFEIVDVDMRLIRLMRIHNLTALNKGTVVIE